MSVFKKTPNLTEDHTANPETPIRPKSKIRGLFISPGTRTKIKIKTNETRSPFRSAKAEAKTFKETQNIIAETEDIGSHLPEIYTPELLFSSQNQAGPVGGRLERFWKVGKILVQIPG